MRRSLIALCVLASVACGTAKPARVQREVTLYAATSTGEAVAGLRAWTDGAAIGETDPSGALKTVLRSEAGRAVTLTWACPTGYASSDERRTVVLDAADTSANSPDASTLTPLMLKALCEPLERMAVLVVRIRGAPASGLPIRARDEVVGRTDPDGLAHILLRVRPMSTLAVGIDTSEHPSLIPQSPIETFHLGADESILLLERELAVRKPGTVKQRPSVRQRDGWARPYRIR